VTKTGSFEDSVVVAKLGKGDGFGDLALINDAPRAATIMTTTDCDLIKVEKVKISW
jgi:CRP-like cAMP-binding protein